MRWNHRWMAERARARKAGRTTRPKAPYTGWQIALRLFLATSFLLAIVGFVAGWRESGFENLADQYDRLRIAKDGDIVVVAHLCKGRWTHTWDPARGMRIMDSAAPAADGGAFLKRAFSPGRHAGLLSALAGGASGGVTIAELAGRSSARNTARGAQKASSVLPERIFALVAGVGAGYFLGYWLGDREARRCDDSRVLQMLGQTKFWDEHVVTALQLYVVEHASNYQESRFYTPYKPAAFCPFPEAVVADSVARKLGSNVAPLAQDMQAFFALGVAVNAIEPQRRREFSSCIESVGKRIRNAIRDGHYMNDTGWIEDADTTIVLPSTEACRSFGGDQTWSIPTAEYMTWRESPFVRLVCEQVRLPTSIKPPSSDSAAAPPIH